MSCAGVTLQNDVRGNDVDELLLCLQFLSSHFNRSSSKEVLTAGLPLSGGCLTPELFIRGAERASLSAKVLHGPISEFSSLYLPCVLYVEQGSPVILLSIDSTGLASVFFPKLDAISNISLNDLERSYIGHGILIKPTSSISETDAFKPVYSNDDHWFWGTVKSYRRNYFYIVLAASIINLLGLALPLFTMNVYDRVLPNAALSTLFVLSVGVFIAILFDFLLKSARAMVIDKVGRQIDIRLSTALFSKIMNTKLSHRPMTTGAFANRINEYEIIREVFTSGTIALLTDLCFVVVFLIFIYHLVGWLIWVPVLGLLLVLLSSLVVQRLMSASISTAHGESAMRHSLLVESLSAIETVKGLCAEGHILKKWENFIRHGSGTQEYIKNLSAINSNIALSIHQIVAVCVIIGGVSLFAEGKVSMGEIIATMMLSNRACAPFGQLAGILLRARHAFTSIATLNQIMEQPDDYVTATNFIHRPIVRGEITFCNVSFAYPATRCKALENISLTIQPGEKIGILGKIGSGKTTLGRLMTALYETTEGDILIDGVSISQYHPHEVRKAMAILMQDTELFHGSVRENITIAVPCATDEEILRVSKIAGVDDFVSCNPRGFDMQVGERGRNVSGGQRQMIAFARALLKKPKLLFLDEPSGSMDIASERGFIQRLSSIMTPDKTLLISTHRHTMLSLVDRLLVLDKGKLVADGPRDEVLGMLSKSSQ